MNQHELPSRAWLRALLSATLPALKRCGDEAQAATLAIGKEQTKRWLRILNDHWLGDGRNFLCGDEIAIADYFGGCLVSLGETIKIDFAAYPSVRRWLDHVAKLPGWARVNEAFYGLVRSAREGAFVTVP